MAACSSSRPMPTAENVSLEKYQGRWYDIAHLPQKFQDDCKCVTADYTLKEEYVEVVNTCVDVEDNESRKVEGKAFVAEEGDNSKLKVQFFWPFKGDYYIIELEENYSYALVGSPDRESLWILARDPQPSAMILKKYMNRAEELGFETSKMVYTDQGCHVTKDVK